MKLGQVGAKIASARSLARWLTVQEDDAGQLEEEKWPVLVGGGGSGQQRLQGCMYECVGRQRRRKKERASRQFLSVFNGQMCVCVRVCWTQIERGKENV